VRFYDSSSQLHYGWIQFDGGYASGTIVDWAYESIPNTPFEAGAIMPEPAQAGAALGLLALGAAGVRRMRRTATVCRSGKAESANVRGVGTPVSTGSLEQVSWR